MCNLRKISAKCKSCGVKHVFVSGLMYTSKKKKKLLVGINRMIKELCMSDYEYIDNENIPRDMLYKDSLHLLDKGKYFLSRNFIENLNQFLKTHVCHPTVLGSSDIIFQSLNISDEFSSVNSSDLQSLKLVRSDNTENPMIGYLNLNSLRNKIIDLREVLKHISLDYFVVSETKLDNSFPCA